MKEEKKKREPYLRIYVDLMGCVMAAAAAAAVAALYFYFRFVVDSKSHVYHHVIHHTRAVLRGSGRRCADEYSRCQYLRFQNLFFLLATVRDAVCSRITHSRHVRHSEIHFYSDFEARVCVCVSFDLIHTHLIECWHRISIAFLWKFNSCQNIPFTSMTAVHLAMCKPANSPNSLHLNSIQI